MVQQIVQRLTELNSEYFNPLSTRGEFASKQACIHIANGFLYLKGYCSLKSDIFTSLSFKTFKLIQDSVIMRSYAIFLLFFCEL